MPVPMPLLLLLLCFNESTCGAHLFTPEPPFPVYSPSPTPRKQRLNT